MTNAKLASSSKIQTWTALAQQIKLWGEELGFADVGITDTDLSHYEPSFFRWLDNHYHGDMDYMARHGTKRTRPQELEPATLSVVSVRMNYYDLNEINPLSVLHNPNKAYISRYALGKDYHKLLRKRLQKLAEKISQVTEDFNFRAFTDSAPVLEGPIAEKAGLGFIGKNSLNIHHKAGSWFFLGELFCNLPLPADPPYKKQGCGPCRACIQECPTQAIIADGVVDSRRCISYLTIEYEGVIPEEFRQAIGNRIYGCDDCQLVCPWNKFTEPTEEQGFKAQQALSNPDLLALWQWDEKQFLNYFQGSAIRRIGYAKWQRNLAIAMGNMQGSNALMQEAISLLQKKRPDANSMVSEHIDWAIQNIQSKSAPVATSSYHPIEFKPWVAKKYFLPKINKLKQ